MYRYFLVLFLFGSGLIGNFSLTQPIWAETHVQSYMGDPVNRGHACEAG